MVTDVQFAQIGTSKNLLSKESPTDPGRSQANSLETPLAAVWKRGLQNQRKRNKLLKAIWTNLPLKAWLSPSINQISHGFIWLSLENLQGPRVHNSSKKCIPVLYCPPTEEILLMSSFNLPGWKLWPLPSNLLWVSTFHSKFPVCVAAWGYSAPGTRLHTPYWMSWGPIHRCLKIPLDWSSVVQGANHFP